MSEKFYADNPEIARRREEYYTALESGEYPQTRDSLRTQYGYCCLGVAHEVSGLRMWEEFDDGYVSRPKEPNGGESSTTHLTCDVADYYGFNSTNPILNDPSGNMHHATQYNDTLCASFTQIARAFRDRYPARVKPEGDS